MQVFEGCTGCPVPSLMHRRRVMEKPITYVGLDVHKDTIAVALVEMGKRGEVREHGKIANTPAALTTLAGKLARTGAELRFCYEAGPCGRADTMPMHLKSHLLLRSGPTGGDRVAVAADHSHAVPC